MAITTATNLASGITSTAGDLFGLNTWQIRDGIYNGVTFCSAGRSDMAILNTGLGGQIFDSIDGVTASLNSYNGKTLKDTNSRQMLIDTTLNILDMKSEFLLQNAIKRFPLAKESIVEDLGSGGWVHSFVIQIVGQDYSTAIKNIQNAILNAEGDKSLTHPTLGKISGKSYVINFNYNENFTMWRGATLYISFLSQSEVSSQPIPKSVTQQVFNAATACLSAVNTITTTFAVLQGYYNQVSNLVAPRTKNSQLAAVSTTVNNATQSLGASTNYIIKTSNSGAKISSLSNTPIDYAALPIILNGVDIPATGGTTKTYNDNQGLILIDSYSKQVTQAIISLAPLGGDANDLKMELYKSVSLLAGLAMVAGTQQPSQTFIVPYPMSLSMVLHLNNIDLNLAHTVFMNNPQLSSANYITQGEVVYL